MDGNGTIALIVLLLFVLIAFLFYYARRTISEFALSISNSRQVRDEETQAAQGDKPAAAET